MGDLTTADQAPIERRQFRRYRTLLGAQISFRSSFFCSMAGHIFNISETGALLRPTSISSCLNRFSLKPRNEPSRTCEVVWRRGEMMGIKYID